MSASATLGKIRTATAIALVLVLISGCSVINPHIRPEADSLTSVSETDFYGDLPKAINRANKERQKYFDAVAEQSILRNTIGLTLIPLSASALYLGFASAANAELAAGLGLAAGGLYSMGSYLHSVPRQRVYLEGSRAIGCAVFAMRPLLLMKDEYTQLSAALAAFPAKRLAVDTDIRLLEGALTKLAELDVEDPVFGEAEAQADQARQLLAAADGHARSGSLYKREVEVAGATLDASVRDIMTEVSRQVIDTEPTLASVMNATSHLGQLAGQFGHLSTALAVAGSGTGVGQPKAGFDAEDKVNVGEPQIEVVKRALNELRESTSALAGAVNEVARAVNAASDMAKASGDLKSCRVGAVAGGFKLVPDVDSQEIQAGQSFVFSIVDESGIPQVQLSGAKNDKVKLDTGIADGMVTATISADMDAPSGSMSLIVKNGLGKLAKVVALRIKGGTAAEESGKKPENKVGQQEGGWNSYLLGDEKDFLKAEDDARFVQCALGVKVDGKLGKDSRSAISKYQSEHAQELGVGTLQVIDLQDLRKMTYDNLVRDHPECGSE